MGAELKNLVSEHRAEVAVISALVSGLYDTAGDFAKRLKTAAEEAVACLEEAMRNSPEPKDRIASAKILLMAADSFAKIQFRAQVGRPTGKEIGDSLTGFVDMQKVKQELKDEYAQNPLRAYGILADEGKKHDADGVGGFHGSPIRPM